MKLNKTGSVARFYCRSYHTTNPPENFCTFFWKLVWATALLPMTWWTYFWEWPLAIRFVISFVTSAVFAAIGTGLYRNWLGTLIGLGAIGLLGGTGALLIHWKEDGAPEVISDVTDVISTKWHSVKDGYCPKIDWR